MGVWIETCDGLICFEDLFVTPCMGVWIETERKGDLGKTFSVTPCMGVWIETRKAWGLSNPQIRNYAPNMIQKRK